MPASPAHKCDGHRLPLQQPRSCSRAFEIPFEWSQGFLRKSQQDLGSEEAMILFTDGNSLKNDLYAAEKRPRCENPQANATSVTRTSGSRDAKISRRTRQSRRARRYFIGGIP